MKTIKMLIVLISILCIMSCKKYEKKNDNNENIQKSEIATIDNNTVLNLENLSNQLITQEINIEEFCRNFIGKTIDGNYNSEGIEKNGRIIGYLEYVSIDHIGEFFWFEKLDNTSVNQQFVCTQIEFILYSELNNLCLCKRLNKYSTESETLFSLYFFNKVEYLQAEKEYTPQYLLHISNDTGIFEITENKTITFINDL